MKLRIDLNKIWKRLAQGKYFLAPIFFRNPFVYFTIEKTFNLCIQKYCLVVR